MIIIKSKREIELMREPCKVTAELLHDLEDFVKPGLSTMDVNNFVEKRITGHGMTPTFKGYGGFPAAACVSVNDEVIHGIPNAARILREGDIVYIYPKKKRAERRYPTYYFRGDDTAWDIAQRYGIKLKSLYELNGIPYGTPLTTHQRLNLR